MKNRRVRLVDTTLRDGSHAVRHSFDTKQVKKIAKGLDKSGIELIEISHGDGLGGSSFNYGFSTTDELKLIEAAAKEVKNGKVAVLLLPGIGTIADLKKAKKAGADAVRVATHVTEADVSAEHIYAAKELDMMAVGFLMMVHMAPVERIVEEALKMESYGADYINMADSSGYLLPEDVAARIKAVAEAVKIPVVGLGGIMNATDAIEFMLAGASAIEIGTANFIDPAITVKVAKGIDEYLERHGFKSVKDIIGALEV